MDRSNRLLYCTQLLEVHRPPLYFFSFFLHVFLSLSLYPHLHQPARRFASVRPRYSFLFLLFFLSSSTVVEVCYLPSSSSVSKSPFSLSLFFPTSRCMCVHASNDIVLQRQKERRTRVKEYVERFCFSITLHHLFRIRRYSTDLFSRETFHTFHYSNNYQWLIQ